VFICDFISAVKICQVSLHSMYKDPATCFSTDEFWSCNNLLDYSDEQIHIKWLTDLNDGTTMLSFVCHGEQIHVEHKLASVDRNVWASIVSQVKLECTGEICTILVSYMFFFSFSIFEDAQVICLCAYCSACAW